MAAKPKISSTVAFPEHPVKLLNGKTVVVKPWSLKNGRLIRQKITDTFDALQAAGKTPGSLTEVFDMCEQQVVEIVRDTLGVDDAWMEENLAYEDLFTLAQAVVEVCLLRGGKDGVLGKVMGAMGLETKAELAPGLLAKLEEARQLGRDEAPSPTSNETTAL